ncbi:MAG: PQQ-binding-like beta-propeller repeat protein [Pirellulales bacterium]|nr:PQQ-binding-like beta-propeller repeat protein [Pirellulales bacterium]
MMLFNVLRSVRRKHWQSQWHSAGHWQSQWHSVLCWVFVLAVVPAAFADQEPVPPGGDCAQWGGSSARNNVRQARDVPVEWNVGKFDRKTGAWDRAEAKNIQWVARLGAQTYGTPIVAGDKVFCATNNGAGWLARYPARVDLGCLLAFSRSDGSFVWQHSVEKHAAGNDVDWAHQGICSNPLVEGDRLWVVTNRGEVVCLDTQGFADGENDGPFDKEAVTGAGESDVVWSFDMMREVGSVQHNMASCSVTAVGDLLLVNTSNGVDESHENVPAGEAPSFLALDKRSGKLLWSDNSPGRNILHGQWASPAAAMLGGVPQAIFPGGDGWVYSFLAEPSDSGKPTLLWKFDCNPKESVWKGSGRGERAELIAAPVVCDGHVYVVTGHDPEFGEADGRIWCIDPARRGDVSPTIVVDRDGKPVAPRRAQAADVAAGEVVRPNPNSAAVWEYVGRDADGDGQRAFEEQMHRSLAMVAVADGILVVGDLSGLVHCVDAKTGQGHWTYDMLAAIWGSPLVADGKVYLTDEDGDVAVFQLSTECNLLAENAMGEAIYTTPVLAGNTLYIAAQSRLFAIEESHAPAP